MGSKVLNHHYSNLRIAVVIVLMAAAACVCYGEDPGYKCSRATYFGSPDCLGGPRGACGYGEYGTTVNNGIVAGVSRLFRGGAGCGACYQVRCRIPAHCSEYGTKLVVTDFGIGHYTDFVLSEKAYASLARPNMAGSLFAYGVVDIEYRRIPCQYDSNLKIKVHEHSAFPHYLAVLPIYVAGIYDVTAIEIWQEDRKQWRPMRRVFGTVWDVQNPPLGISLSIRIQLTVDGSGEVKLVVIAGAIPSDWKAGVAYDTAIKLN